MEKSPAVCLYSCTTERLRPEKVDLKPHQSDSLCFSPPFIFVVAVSHHLAVRPHLSEESNKTLTAGELFEGFHPKMLYIHLGDRCLKAFSTTFCLSLLLKAAAAVGYCKRFTAFKLALNVLVL